MKTTEEREIEQPAPADRMPEPWAQSLSGLSPRAYQLGRLAGLLEPGPTKQDTIH